MAGEHGRKIIPVSSSEALSIGSGLSVQLIIHALTIILSDNNAPAKAALSYQLSDKSTDGIWSKAWMNKTPLNIPEAFLNEKSRSELRKIPLFELVHVIIRQLCLDQPEWEAETGFITGFLDGILEFMKEDNPDAERFLDWWETTGKTRAVMMPDENDTIRILTIHKSKGLEFPIVFVPFCDWSILPSAQNSPWIWCNPNQHKINPLKLAPIKFGKRMEQSVFAHSYYEEIQLNYADTLNLLYVAFTRAVKGLFISFQVQENQSGLSQGKSSTLILKTIENSIFQASPENPNKFTLGDILSLEKEPIKIEQNTQVLQLHSENWMDRLRVKKIARKLPAYSSAKSKTEYGIFIHAVLEKIRYQEDAERVIRELMYSGYIPESEVENILNKLNQIFADPIAGKWFQKPIRCKNEASILSPDGKISRPDRIMFDQDKIILVDFKTGKRKPEDIEQLKSYTILLSEMNYKNIEAWLLYLNEDKIELKAIE
jgi:ATP-dependent exoDNAse (exonuclease V) beta subunit